MHSAEVDLKVGHNTPLLRSTAPQQQIGFTGGFFPRLSRLVWLRCVSFRGPGSLSGIVAVIAYSRGCGCSLRIAVAMDVAGARQVPTFIKRP